jgi:Flp pilus assembly protein TadG
MMRQMTPVPLVRDERGSVMIFSLAAMILLLVMGGLAIDLASQFTLRSEIQRSMDAAALAGAGKLAYTTGSIPTTVRDFAVSFAGKNAIRAGTIALARNDINSDTAFDSASAPYGDVVTGHWNYATRQFSPSTDPTITNAVMCRYKTSFQTSLLRLWGITSLPAQAGSIATADPASQPPLNGCTIPVGLSSCSFLSNQIFTANGCGTVVKFVTSNTQQDSTNTAGWVSLTSGQTANASNIQGQVNAGACTGGVPVGTSLSTSNGMLAPAFDAMETKFRNAFNASVAAGTTYTVKKADGTNAYSGPGWEVFVPVIGTTCPAGAITGNLQVVGWTRMVMTQMWDPTGGNPSKNDGWNATNQSCLVNNPSDPGTWGYCTNPSPPAPLNQGSSRSIWGYYNCAAWVAPPIATDAPLSSITTKLRVRQ